MKSRLHITMGSMKAILSLVWVIVGFAGMVYGVRWVRWAGEAIDQTMDEIRQNAEVVTSLLAETMDVFAMVDQSLSTVESSIIQAAIAMGGTTPMIGKTSQIVVEDVPQALDDVQASMPSVIQAATAIEQALYLLSGFQYSIPVPFGNPIQLGLGIDYAPDVPLEQALTNLSGNLEGIPASMRAIESDLTKTEDNLLAISDNLLDIARDIDRVREQIADIYPELETLIANFEAIQITLENTQTQLPSKVTTAEAILVSILALLLLSQVPNFYFAVQLLKKGNMDTVS